MHSKLILILTISLFTSFILNAQVSINTTSTPPDSSAMLDISSTSKGLLIPRMSAAQRNDVNAIKGLLVFDNDSTNFFYYTGIQWKKINNINEVDPKISIVNTNYIPKWDGSTLTESIIYDNGVNVGIGTPTPSASLEVVGKTKTSNFQMTNGAANGSLLQSSANGNASWVSNSSVLGNNLDTNFLAKWNGNNFSNSEIYNHNGSISVGTKTPNAFGGNFTYNKFMLASDSFNTSDFNLIFAANDINSGWINSGKARGTLAALQAVEKNDDLLVISANGYVGSQFEKGATIEFTTDSLTSSYVATSISFRNTNVNGNFAERMRISTLGNVGIGTANPTQAKLVVNGNINTSVDTFSYLQKGTPITGTNTTGNSYNYSIYASNRIAASEFNAFSDERIKNIKSITNNNEDLNTLNKIQITNYKLKDSIAKGNVVYKKVIAQQVEQVYPQAVTQLTDFIPNIYSLCTFHSRKTQMPYSSVNMLSTNDKLKLITVNGEVVVTIVAINGNEVEIDNAAISGDVFVYGTQVSDFRSVDYEALTTLNISATQALLKKMNEQEQRILRLEKQQSQILNVVNTLQSNINLQAQK